jgi:hypothetical protein
MSAGYYPVATYRTSTVTNGGTTTQAITSFQTEARQVTDTKNLTDTTTRALTESGLSNGQQIVYADIGSSVKFVLKIPNKGPVQIPPVKPANPNTT